MRLLLTNILAFFVMLSTLIDCGGLRPLDKSDGPVDDMRELKLYFDWSQMEEKPTGMTVILYPEYGGSPLTYKTNTVDSLVVVVPDMNYNVLVFNQTVEEFGMVGFRGLEAIGTAEVFALEGNGTRAYNSSVKMQAGKLATKSVKTTTSRGYNTSRGYTIASSDKMFITPENRIYDMSVTVHVRGLQYAADVRGSISGLAAGFMLGNEKLDTEPLTQELYGWEKNDFGTSDVGTVDIHFGTFGIPHITDDTSGSQQVVLNMEFLLVDGTIIPFSFPVTKYIEVHEEGIGTEENVTLEIELEVGTDINNEGGDNMPPLELPEAYTGGMHVAPWGNVVNIDLQMKK